MALVLKIPVDDQHCNLGALQLICCQ